MTSREEAIQLVEKLGYNNLASFIESMVEANNSISLEDGWALKWMPQQWNLQVISFEKKLAFTVCFFAGCKNEIAPGNYCQHFNEPLTLQYSQSSKTFVSEITVLMGKLGIPQENYVFAYNALVKHLKHKGKLVNGDFEFWINRDNAIVVNQPKTGTQKTLCGLPGCFADTVRINLKDKYCMEDRGLDHTWIVPVDGKDAAKLFRVLTQDAATKLGETFAEGNLTGWKKILLQFATFEDHDEYAIPHLFPGDSAPSDIRIVLGLSGQLQIIFKGYRYGVCNQPFCCRETEKNHTSIYQPKLFASVFRCFAHQVNFTFGIEDFKEIFSEMARLHLNL